MSLKPTRLPPFYPPIQTTLAPGSENDDTESEGPSWGLIIPIIMIGAFLACVVLCLWWHKWRDRRMRLNKSLGPNGNSFQRSYRGSRKSRGSYDLTRDSMRSTTPLRSSLNEKHRGRSNHIQTKMINVNVMPVPQRPNTGKYSFYWDRNHLKAVPTPIARTSAKPLSPINEIDSPLSAKLSELSHTYNPVGTQSYSPYHIAWMTSSNAPPSYEESESASCRGVRHQVEVQRPGTYSPNIEPHVTNDQLSKSPFFPNNNTPTTECDTESEGSQHRYHNIQQASQDPSYISCNNSSSMFSRSNPLPSRDHSSDRTGTSFASSYHEFSNQTSSKQSQSALQQSSSLYTSRSTTDQHTTNLSSLPSSIAPFSKQNCMYDLNNNSSMMPNANISYPRSKAMNFTLASSISSDTHISDNTSMLPNVGSNNTSSYPNAMFLRSRQPSVEPSGPGSPEDLSKLVDEMSSIRPVDESSSMRPNSTMPTPHITTISGTSLSIGIHRSWSVQGDMGNMSSINSTNSSSQANSQEGSMYWDNYPLTAEARAQSKSFQELPLHVYENHSFVGHVPELNYYVPILKDQQYWV